MLDGSSRSEYDHRTTLETSAEARRILPEAAPRSVSPSRTTYSVLTSVTPGRSVITRASAQMSVNARLAMMDFPKAAVIGLIGDVESVPHDYMLDGLDLPSRLRAQAEIEAKRRAGATVWSESSERRCCDRMADEIWWFAEGAVRFKGDPDEVLAHINEKL